MPPPETLRAGVFLAKIGANAMYKTFAAAILASSISGASHAQQNGAAELCSTYFQARADWLRSLGGNRATIQTMESYAQILWYSVPRDDGILKGFSKLSPHDPDIITSLMSGWAEQGGQLPLCMEDATCNMCTNALRAVD